MTSKLERRIIDALLGKPLVTNAFRGMLVEAMLAEVLAPDWRWCGADWASHDFENAAGVRLEVKQSAALQSWHGEGARPNPGRFDIAARKMRWEGTVKVEEGGRAAAIYVFAWHPECDAGKADHRDPAQWEFHIVPASALPPQKTLGLTAVRRLAGSVKIDAVAGEVAAALSRLGFGTPGSVH